MKGVTKRTDMSVEALAVVGSTAFDISDDSRASFLPIGYSSLPSVVETLPQVSGRQNAKGSAHGHGPSVDVENDFSTT